MTDFDKAIEQAKAEILPFESWERLPGESGAADYDRCTEKLKQAEFRKTIEAQGEAHRAVTGKMLEVVSKKLDLMDPADLTQGTVTEWVGTVIRVRCLACRINQYLKANSDGRMWCSIGLTGPQRW